MVDRGEWGSCLFFYSFGGVKTLEEGVGLLFTIIFYCRLVASHHFGFTRKPLVFIFKCI